jgi:hypothetical protein
MGTGLTAYSVKEEDVYELRLAEPLIPINSNHNITLQYNTEGATLQKKIPMHSTTSLVWQSWFPLYAENRVQQHSNTDLMIYIII